MVPRKKERKKERNRMFKRERLRNDRYFYLQRKRERIKTKKTKTYW